MSSKFSSLVVRTENAFHIRVFMFTVCNSKCSLLGNPTEKETEQITQLWQSSLFNANVELQR